MRILQLHSNYIQYKPITKEIEVAEEADKKEIRVDEVVVLFTAIEEGDNDSVALKAVSNLHDYLEQIKVNRVLVYPYAHLSSDLAKPKLALKVIKAIERYLKKAGIETFRAPFGWNKQFSISIKGHPLAEQLRIIKPIEKRKKRISEALRAEEKEKSFWFIMQPDGKMIPVEEFDFTDNENLKKFAKYEISKIRESREAPPHTKLMRRLEIADYEPASDPGNLRWYPKGRLIKSLIEQFVTNEMLEYGAMEVETPVMYDFNHPSLSDYLDRFPARQYVVKSEDKDLFLRFAACFGQFLLLHDTHFSYRQLPLRIYELTRYSFRREKSGEIAGLRRQRAFTMPDCHAICADLKQAKDEFIIRFKICMHVLSGIEIRNEDYDLAIRFTEKFHKENTAFITSLVKFFGKPVLVELLPSARAYWVFKWEFNFVDNQEKASALSTDQIDVENAQRYDITYVDEKGENRHPMILHCSPSGGVERCIYAILEKAYREQQNGNIPILPLWLSPTQVRFVPVSDKFTEDAERVASKIGEHHIRVDFDDRNLTLQRKIREAETEWINYIVVIGKREIDTETLSVRDRMTGKIIKMKLQELVEQILEATKGKPFKPLPLPKRMSRRPQFYG